MTPFVSDPDFTLYVGDALTVLQGLPDESVHCCVTSPPYWGLRDYGTGAWEGGDPGCDHKNESTVLGNTRRNLAQAANKADGGNRVAENRADHDGDQFAQYRDECGKCGATRVDNQLGLEPTPDEYVAAIVAVFREVRRVLRADGTLWLNLGDSYARGRTGRDDNGVSNQGREAGWKEHPEIGSADRGVAAGLKEKDLVGIPWRVVFALQADGWYLRSDIIWSKPNPMPESVTDRPTKAHEYVFLLTRSPRYFFDQEAVREAFDARPQQRLTANVDMPLGAARVAAGVQQGNPQGGAHVSRFAVQAETLDGSEGEAPRGPDGRRATHVEGQNGSIQHRDGERWPNGGRNLRSVWEIATQPYPDAHFATFPEALPDRCIRAGTSERGCCPECGAAWVREVERQDMRQADGSCACGVTHGNTRLKAADGGGHQRNDYADGRDRLYCKASETTGWSPSCDCGLSEGAAKQAAVNGGIKTALPSPFAEPVPCTVLDPFLGSGTTALVARKLGRRTIGIELSPEYAALAARRLQQLSLLAEPA